MLASAMTQCTQWNERTHTQTHASAQSLAHTRPPCGRACAPGPLAKCNLCVCRHFACVQRRTKREQYAIISEVSAVAGRTIAATLTTTYLFFLLLLRNRMNSNRQQRCCIRMPAAYCRSHDIRFQQLEYAHERMPKMRCHGVLPPRSLDYCLQCER